MSRSSSRAHLAPQVRIRLASCLTVFLSVCLTAGPMAASAAAASVDPTTSTVRRHVAPGALAVDLASRSAAHAPRLIQHDRGKSRTGHAHRAGVAGGTSAHGTDTRGEDDSATDRDLALAATWRIDPTLLKPQPGDSAATLDARAELAAVAHHIHGVMGRYKKAHAAAQEAAAAGVRARAELEQARADAATAHHLYVRDHRILVQMAVTSYEQGPVTSMQYFLTMDSTQDLMVGIGTMQQLARNQASVVADAEAATARMEETAARAEIAAEAARSAGQRAHDTLAVATDASQKVLDQLNQVRRVLTLSVLADQMQTTLADAMKYANQLKPGSVSFPLPPNSGFYDNHNWGEHSAHWASFHTGDDYSVACGTPVLAATAGTIEILTDQEWAGRWLVMVSTGHGKLSTWYAHMEALAVKPGQRVKPGQIIGEVGEGGNATGCHLHFELHPDGGSIYQDTTDPDPWLKAIRAYPGS
jgi:murein DD-endopeptidase MepM/ murein hydrolase activator NlpD